MFRNRNGMMIPSDSMTLNYHRSASISLKHQKQIQQICAEDVQIFIYDHNKDQVANYALDVLANSDAWTTQGRRLGRQVFRGILKVIDDVYMT